MAFKVILAAHSGRPDHAVLMGIAHGLGELYSLPTHPCAVDDWLNSNTTERAGSGDQTTRRDKTSREMLDEA